MKKIWLILIILIIIIIISLVIILLKNKKVELTKEGLEYFHFSYSNGYAINSNIIYEINKKDNKYVASIKPYGISDNDKKEVEITIEILKQIEEILNKYEVYSWNNFHKSNKNVLDGDSFSFNLKTKENNISASGYMRWPSNYRIVKDELDKIFDSLYKKDY